MRYNGSKYGNSEWSNTVVINTLEVDEKIIYFEYPSQGENYYENNIRTLLKNNGDIYCTGYAAIALNNQGELIGRYGDIKPYIIKLDSQLNVLKQAIMPYGGDISHSKILTNGNICLIGRVAYTKVYNAFIATIDTNLNIIKSLVFNLPDQSNNGTPVPNDQVCVFLEEYNNELYLFSSNSDSPTPSTSLLKLNMDLTVLSNKKYTNGVGTSGGCIRIFNGYIYLTISGSYIIKMDLNFNIIKKYHLRIGVGASPSYFIINNNKLYVCSTSFINGYQTSYITILDLDLNILSCKKLLSGQIRGISIINNKIFLTGINYINNEKYYGYIGVYDTNLNLISNIALSDNNATHNSIIYGTTNINNGFISHGFIGNKQVLISYNDILDIPKDVLLGDTLISKTATVFNETTTAVLQEVTDLIVGTNSYVYHNNVLTLIPCNYLVRKTLDV